MTNLKLAAICRPVHVTTTRTQRRVLTLACYLGYVLLIGASLLASASESPVLNAVRIALVLVVMVGYAGLVLATAGNPAQTQQQTLDERERRVREHAYATAYVIVSGLVVLATGYAAVALSFGDTLNMWLPRTWEDFQALMWAVVILTTTLPGALVGWSEPDLPKD